MRNRHRQTLEAIFRDPVSATIVWSDVERLLLHLGASILERGGSRIKVDLNEVRGRFHRPHPGKEAKPYVIRALRDFFTAAGVLP